jgi:hypothetical protein
MSETVSLKQERIPLGEAHEVEPRLIEVVHFAIGEQ